MKTTIKIIALVLAFIMILPSFIACTKEFFDDSIIDTDASGDGSSNSGSSNSGNSNNGSGNSNNGNGNSNDDNGNSNDDNGSSNGSGNSSSDNENPSSGENPSINATFPSSLNDPEKKKQNDDILAELMPIYNTLREEIRSGKAGYDFGKEDSSIGTPNSNWKATLPAITEDHPRLLVTKNTIPTVRKSLLEDNPTNKRFFELLDKPTSTINNGKLAAASKDFDGRKGMHNYRKDYLEFIQII